MIVFYFHVSCDMGQMLENSHFEMVAILNWKVKTQKSNKYRLLMFDNKTKTPQNFILNE